jgi:hypothetical protein
VSRQPAYTRPGTRHATKPGTRPGAATGRRPRHAAPGRRGRASAPVFVDVTGRRRRIVRHLVIVAGLLMTAYFSVVSVGLLVGADAPLTPWPDKARHSPDVGVGMTGPTSGGARGTPPPSSAGASPAPGATHRATPGAAATAVATSPPAATVTRPGNSRATPRANGRSRPPNPRKS